MSKHTPTPIDWHAQRDELRHGMIFRTRGGHVVELDRTVPGDGTRWYVADFEQGKWFHEDGTIEPGDLVELIPSRAALAKAGAA